MRSEELIARSSITELVGRYCVATDQRDLDAFSKLFLPDGVLQPPGMPEIVGRDAILRFESGLPEDLPAYWHHVTTQTIDYKSSEHAEGIVYFSGMSSTGLDHWGWYDDVYCELDGEWLFKRRQAHMAGCSPGSALADAFKSSE